jgi:HEPN domain-containing protein
MTDIDHARRLLVMAGKDLSALRAMGDPSVFSDEVFGFHAQQAVEKLLKAWIALLGGTYPLTHDLRLLIVKLEELGCAVDGLWEFLELASFAVQFRYEELEQVDEPLDRATITSEVDGLFRHVSESVDSEEQCR